MRVGGGHEAAGISRCARQCRDRVAARRSRAAARGALVADDPEYQSRIGAFRQGLEHLRCCCGRWNEAELLQHCQPVKHQIERDMLAVAEAEDLDIVHFDRAACRRNVPHGTVQNAVLRPRECAFLNCDVVDDVNGFDFDTRIRECSEPTGRRIFFESLSFTQL